VYWVSLASAGELVNGDRTQSGTWNYCADAGSTDAYACSHSPALPGYTTGTRYTFKANTANTGAATLNLDSLGAKTLKKMTGAGYIDLEDNDIKVSSIVDVIYDGTNMVLISQLATATKTIASGATALATNAISSGTCATAQTATATGTATTDVILASFNGDVTAVTGYTAVTTGTLLIDVYPTSNTVNIRVCNNTSADITPGSVTLNWRVVR
jgi:hypothetical protein